MQLKQIPRDALLKPLQAVSGIVERRHTLPILANVLLEQKDGQLYVTATDLEMQITAHSELAGKDGAGHHRRRAQAAGSPARAARRRDAQRRRRRQQDDGARRALALQPADAARRRLSAHQPRPRSSCRRSRCRRRTCARCCKLVEFAMAQQDIRYYLNGMLLVIDKALAAGGRHRRPSAVVGEPRRRRRLRAPGSDPAAQDGARARQAARPTATTR